MLMFPYTRVSVFACACVRASMEHVFIHASEPGSVWMRLYAYVSMFHCAYVHGNMRASVLACMSVGVSERVMSG